ncbi:MAG: hypothetical protein AAF797_13280, partial [Planctomycetota bacterium]
RVVHRGHASVALLVSSDLEVDDELLAWSAERVAPLGWVPPDPPQEMPEEPQPFEYYAQQMQQQQQSFFMKPTD